MEYGILVGLLGYSGVFSVSWICCTRGDCGNWSLYMGSCDIKGIKDTIVLADQGIPLCYLGYFVSVSIIFCCVYLCGMGY